MDARDSAVRVAESQARPRSLDHHQSVLRKEHLGMMMMD
jgi:hypothetical protein